MDENDPMIPYLRHYTLFSPECEPARRENVGCRLSFESSHRNDLMRQAAGNGREQDFAERKTRLKSTETWSLRLYFALIHSFILKTKWVGERIGQGK